MLCMGHANGESQDSKHQLWVSRAHLSRSVAVGQRSCEGERHGLLGAACATRVQGRARPRAQAANRGAARWRRRTGTRAPETGTAGMPRLWALVQARQAARQQA